VKIYITKYALTSGIIEDEGKETEINGMIKAVGMHMYVLKPDWHEKREEAIKRANVMKEKKILSLKKQLTKVSKLSWD
jgi:hypothetical protein